MKKKLDVKNYGLKCSYCSEIFFPESASSYGAYKKLLNKGKNIFCSKNCREKYDKDMETPCLNCGKMTIGKFCNSSCSATYNNKRRKVTDNHKLKTSLKIKARYCAIREMLNLPLTKSLNNNIEKGLIDKEMVNNYKKILTEKDLLDYSKKFTN